MYKIAVTKYKHTYNNNYFDNSYFLSNNPYSMFLRLQLNFPVGFSTVDGRVYYKWELDSGWWRFKIYSDSARSAQIAEGLATGNFFVTEEYRFIAISPKNSSGVTGRLSFISNAENLATTLEGYVELNTGVIDYIELSNLPKGFISNLGEELFNEKNEYVASDYDIVLTNLTTERSNLNLSVFDFFENTDAYIYRVLFYVDSTVKRVGFIDYGSMEKYLDRNDNGQIIKFTVFSAEKQMKEVAEQTPFIQIGYGGTWDVRGDTYNQLITKIADTLRMDINDLTNIQSTFSTWYGRTLDTQYDFLNDLRAANLWDVMCGLFKQMGIMFTIKADNANKAEWNKLTLTLFLRTNADSLSSLNVKSEIEGNKGIDLKYTYWAVKNAELTTDIDGSVWSDSLGADNSEFVISAGGTDGGFPQIQTNSHFVNAHLSFYREIDKKWISTYYPLWAYPDSNIKWIDITMFDSDIVWYDYTYTRALGNEYTFAKFTKITPICIFYYQNSQRLWNTDVNNFCALHYDYLLTNLKKTKRLLCVYENYFDLTVQNRIVYDGIEYFISKIENIDIEAKTCTINLTEI